MLCLVFKVIKTLFEFARIIPEKYTTVGRAWLSVMKAGSRTTIFEKASLFYASLRRLMSGRTIQHYVLFKH